LKQQIHLKSSLLGEAQGGREIDGGNIQPDPSGKNEGKVAELECEEQESPWILKWSTCLQDGPAWSSFDSRGGNPQPVSIPFLLVSVV